MRRRIGLGALTLALALTAGACTGDPAPTETAAPTSTSKPKPKPGEVTSMTFGAYGSQAELKAMQKVVDAFNSASTSRRVELVTWPDHDAALKDVLAGRAPDVFMTSRSDVGRLVADELVRPISLLLDERGVDFGDRYSRDALESFAHDNELQCMAYSISPMVIYYNTNLVDFDAMEETGEYRVPAEPRERWTMSQFADAAEFASRSRGVKGVWIEPTIEGLAPFVHSAGGTTFNDEEPPTSLEFSSDATRDALEEVLQVLRDPLVTPNAKMLAGNTPLQLFKQGRLGMIAGYRDLVPQLREAPDLDFDVISMPNLGSSATVGDISGLCISPDATDVNVAADFVAYAVSDSATETVASTGYIVPANTHVASSDAFLAPGREPEHARVFSSAIRGLVAAPLIEQRAELDALIDPLLEKLLNAPGVLDLEASTEEIDEASRSILDPEYVPEDSESTEPTDSATPSAPTPTPSGR